MTLAETTRWIVDCVSSASLPPDGIGVVCGNPATATVDATIALGKVTACAYVGPIRRAEILGVRHRAAEESGAGTGERIAFGFERDVVIYCSTALIDKGSDASLPEPARKILVTLVSRAFAVEEPNLTVSNIAVEYGEQYSVTTITIKHDAFEEMEHYGD